MIKKGHEMERSRKRRQNTFRLTGAVQIKRNFALLWMSEDLCQEVAMVTLQLSQTSSYCNYISKLGIFDSLEEECGWLTLKDVFQPAIFILKQNKKIHILVPLTAAYSFYETFWPRWLPSSQDPLE